MIAFLRGIVLYQHDGSMVVDVHGVGYQVHVASADDAAIGEEVELFVHTVVREDAITLYGFASADEREFFEMLLVTPGVGPSTAMAALRTMPIDDLATAIENDDVKRVASIPGIGPKTASRIVLELKGRVVSSGVWVAPTPAFDASDAIDDALRALGYSGMEIRQALDGVQLSDDESVALRQALQLLRRA